MEKEDFAKYLKEKEFLNSHDLMRVTRKDLLSVDKKINGRISSARDNEEKFEMFQAKKLAANAIRLSHMVELIETQGISALNDYFMKNKEKIRNNTANKSLKELSHDREIKRVQLLTSDILSKGVVHPKIKKLDFN